MLNLFKEYDNALGHSSTIKKQVQFYLGNKPKYDDMI